MSTPAHQHVGLGGLLRLVTRSIVVGAVLGVIGGWLIFFTFGFVGLEGADLVERFENGVHAGNLFGIRRGLVAGLGISVGLALVSLVWATVTRRHHGPGARPWLSALAGLIVVVANYRSLRAFGDWIGVATVVGMALVAAAAVWVVAPWVLKTPD